MALDFRTMANLRDILARLYYRDADIDRVLASVDMDPSRIMRDPRPVNTWRSILEEAQFHNKVMDIIAVARQERPNVPQLEMAEKNVLLEVQAPELPEGDWRGPTDEGTLEQLTGRSSTLRPISFLRKGEELSRPVARVVLADKSTGSGFLVRGNILITNNHVIATPEQARGAKVEFNYQKNLSDNFEPVDPYDLDPQAGFATSPQEEQGGDDWTAVKIAGDPGAKWGVMALNRLAPGTPAKGDEVIIIQHPGGGAKQIALSHNVVAYADPRRLQYLTDTLEGSSGSPVFDVEWRLVGLHHKGGWLLEPGSKRPVYRNQGIHVNILLDGLDKAAAEGKIAW